MMTAEHFSHFTFSGDARSRGLAYGRELGVRIHATFARYNDRLFAKSHLSEQDFVERAERVLLIIEDFNSDFVTELDAIAEAAGMARWQIYLLNARTEILNAEVGECTALCFPDSALLGQTWDWFDGFEELTVLVTYERPNGARILAFTEPGMLAKIGFNSAGVGVCLNYLDHRHELDGVPVHILTRAILECDDVAGARRSIEHSGFGKSSHFLIADAAGDALSIEFMGANAAQVEQSCNAYLHTNHCIFPGAPADATEKTSSTAQRLARAQSLLASTPERSFAVLHRILTDEDGGDVAINNPFHPSVVFPGEQVGSCGTFIMDLPRGQMHVRKGPGATNPFRTYGLDGSISATT
jgi:isopenicillin-N N-acyltransferase-like protein